MTNELRKTLGRNMRFSHMNEDIDNQIRQLQARNSYDVNAQMQINTLEQQKALNEQQMQQPMSAAEYAEYDDNGQYIGTGMPAQVQPQSNNGSKQMALDSMNHFAQGASLGWSDEAFDIAKSRFINSVGTGVINGVGYTKENNPWEYGKNIANSVVTNTIGTIGGNAVFGSGNNMYKLGRGVMNAGTQILTPTFKEKENTYE